MRVSNKVADELLGQVSALLTRLLWVSKIPHTAQYWWERGMPAGYLDAIHHMEAYSGLPRSHVFNSYGETWMPIAVSPEEVYSVRLRQSGSQPTFVQYRVETPTFVKHLATNADDFHAMVAWLRACDNTYTQVASAYSVLKQTLDMVSTAGQLKRMVPDLLRYMPASAREMVANQKRRSSLPGGWMKVDRLALRNAVDLIAKCYLLPIPSMANPSLSVMDGIDWAYRVPAERLEGYLAQNSWRLYTKAPWEQ